MTQRNPMNERYQNTGEKKTGKTRKSAASAKPATKAASSVYIEGGKSARPQGRMAKAQRRAQVQSDEKKRQKEKDKAATRSFRPNGEEYRRWRRIWWILIVAALLMTSLSFVVNGRTSSTAPVYTMLGTGYAMLIAAIVIDVTKIRKARNAEYAKWEAGYSKAEKKRIKAENARRKAEEKAAAQAGAEEVAEPAPKAKRKWGLGRSKDEQQDSEN